MSLNHAMVVDDSKLARITLQRLLQKHNLKVEVAESGVAALERLKSSKPDIIFMDHLMPELDGFEATQKIKADPETSHIPVIMCTGKEDTDNYDEQAKGIGASGTLSKPPQADQLALILAAAQSGENLVTGASEAMGKPELSIVNTEAGASTIEAVGKDALQPTSDDLKAVFERLAQIEKASASSDLLNEVKERLSQSENSLTTLQESVISLQNSANEPAPSIDNITESVKAAIQKEIEPQLEALKSSQVDPSELKSQLMAEVEQNVAEKVADKVSASIDGLVPAQEPAPVFDEEALAARLTGDIENTLKSLFDGDLKELEDKLGAATDSSISEARKDLDEQLQNTISKLAAESQTNKESSDTEELLSSVRSEVADIATQSAAAMLNANLEDKLSEITNKVQDELELFKDQNAVNAENLTDDPKLITLIENTTKSAIAVQLPESGAESVSAGTESLPQQELQSIVERIGELDRRQDAIMERVNTMQENQTASPGSTSGNGGMVVAGLALVAAVAALAKAFGLF